MNAATKSHPVMETPPPAVHEVQAPLPVRKKGSRRPPLEARTYWDPWLPLHEPSSSIPSALRASVWVVLLILTVATLILMFPAIGR